MQPFLADQWEIPEGRGNSQNLVIEVHHEGKPGHGISNCSPPKGIYLLNIIITLQCWTPQKLNPQQCTLSFLKWCFHLDKACNYTSWLGHCSQELQLIYEELPPFVNHVVRMWIKTYSLPLLLTLSLPSTDPFALLLLPSLHTFEWLNQKPTNQREKNITYGVGTLPGEGRSGSSAHPLVFFVTPAGFPSGGIPTHAF